ncbi:hypothetical protein Ahy_A07g031465 [Arachis hypogaea]|uniref:Uncharacterized protein n=1 Tax=Arachis hypogaea TaxID=3818 RepID=A0A445C425_ARAHY|nr:hypothetical protein Ahy_A07g031465 [Arachis hypogaea]
MPNVPDNRRVERRRRVGTRATDREWRRLDEMIQNEDVHDDRVGQANHRVRRGRVRRRGGNPLVTIYARCEFLDTSLKVFNAGVERDTIS